MRRVETVGLALFTALALQAGPIAEPASRSSETSVEFREGARQAVGAGSRPVLRRYEVREDSSGRLVRVAILSRQSYRISSRSRRDAPRKAVVQGRSGRSSKAGGRLDIDALVRQAGRRYDVDPKLIHAVMRQESNYNPFAVSSKGAHGLMQLLPVTASRFGVKDIFDPAENVQGGVKFLRHLLDRYKGDRSRTLAAYNAGEEAVDRYGGIPPYRETQDFVDRVSRLFAAGNGSVTDGEAQGEYGGRARIVVHVEPSGLIRFETEPD